MTIYVGSLKYNPVSKSHCCAFGRACEDKGYSVRYLFSREHDWLLTREVKEKTTFVGRSVSISSMLRDAVSIKNRRMLKKMFSEDQPTHVYMHNYHFLNHYIAELSKKHGCKFIYHVHEPYVQNKKAHGGLDQYWLHLFEYYQAKLLENTDIAVVSSDMASRLFDLRYPDFSGKKLLIPLMYEDLGDSDPGIQDRKYISFVGPPVPAKNPKKFMEIVRYSNDHDLNLKFLLISRSEVRDVIYFGEKDLEVFHKERITDEEFGGLIKRSIAVLTPYRRETQSSVVLVSYMYGTPVVSSKAGGLPEFVSHGKTGYLLDADEDVEKWVEAVSSVQENFPALSKNCRKYFVENFSGKNWKKYLDALMA